MNAPLTIPFLPALDEYDHPVDAVRILEMGGVRCSVDLTNDSEAYQYSPLTAVYLGHSSDALYVDFFVRCNYLRAVNDKPGTPVWEDSSVAIMLAPEGDRDIRCFYFNCIGTINARIINDTTGSVTPLADEETACIEVHTPCGRSPFREIEGLFTWNVTARIPFNLLGLTPETAKGARLRGNIYKTAMSTSQPHFLSWQPMPPTSPDKIFPESFGIINLE